jgi:RNA polymerase sigma-B factor
VASSPARGAARARAVPADEQEREALILEHLPLVRALARRYADRGEPLDDLIQVGTVGLINAADRFDPERGVDFRSFAAPTVLGEIRRHFRDRTWTLKVPRGLKDDYATVSQAVSSLQASLGRAPTVAEVAGASDLDEERVLDALAAHTAYRPRSLSAPLRPGEEQWAREVPTDESGYELAEDRTVLAEGLRQLPARERVILHLRFEKGMLQSDIAARLGISQMHVSRLIARSLETLRRLAGETE